MSPATFDVVHEYVSFNGAHEIPVNTPAVHYVAAVVGFLLWGHHAFLYWRHYRTTRDKYTLGGVVLLAFFCFLTLTPIWLFNERVPPPTILAVQVIVGFVIIGVLHVIRARR